MTNLPYLDAAAIGELVSLPDAMSAIAEVFARGPHHVDRVQLAAGTADLLIMPAVGAATAGVKLITVQPNNAAIGEPTIQGTYVLFDNSSGRPVAMLDGAALTALRTPAVSAVATRSLARRDARSCVVIGRGPQGHAHAAAMGWLGLDVTMIGRGETVPISDVVCTCTSSSTPILLDSDVAAGTHINAVGSYRPERREVDGALVAHSTVWVDEATAARAEAGDLIIPANSALWNWERVAGDLGDICRGRGGRSDEREITLFKSVGLALEDLAVAELAARRAGLLN